MKEWSNVLAPNYVQRSAVGAKARLAWERPAYRATSSTMRSWVILGPDRGGANDFVPRDVRVKLAIKAFVNPDHGDYKRSADHDSLFHAELMIRHQGGVALPPALDSMPQGPGRDIVSFRNAHEFEVEVLEVAVDEGSGYRTVPRLPEGVSLSLGMRWAHRVAMAGTETVALTAQRVDCGEVPFELQLSWPTITGADEYQVEWAFIDDYAPNGSQMPAASLAYDLRRDATRATTDRLYYGIPLHYDRGYVVYRVRPIGHNNASLPIYGQWTTVNDQGPVTGIDRLAIPAHQPLKNWQVTSSFAEQGRHKEVMTYADGSLRDRQVVTRNNSLNVPIVGETVYDVIGRPAVEMMPVPMIESRGCEEIEGADWAPIDYYPEFNRNGSSVPYGPQDITGGEVGCGLQAAPVSSSSGAGLYYSPDQLSLVGKLIGNYSFLPKASGYPFSQTAYTRDNTGRVRAKGGVGPAFQLGSGHETRLLYDAPDQTQLDRLFGTESGFASHYQRTTTIDGNGQASISYTDRAGRTVATSLVGEAPAQLEALPSLTTQEAVAHSTRLMCSSLPSWQCTANLFDPALPGYIYTDQFVVPVDARSYTLRYTVTPPQLTFECPEDLCYHCVYEYSVRIVDACGTTVAQSTSFLGRYTDGVVSFACEADGTLQAEDLVRTLDAGEYTLTKTLRIVKDAVDQYEADFLLRAPAACNGLTLDGFINQYLSAADPEGCAVTCQQCYDALGSLAGFVGAGLGTPEEYSVLHAKCDELCKEPSWCEVAYTNMLTDMVPGGQYATYHRNSGVVSVSERTSVLYGNPSGSLLLQRMWNSDDWPFGWDAGVIPGKALWRQPLLVTGGMSLPEYHDDATGDRTRITVVPDGSGNFLPPVSNTGDVFPDEEDGLYTYPENLRDLIDFLDAWRMGWERSLVRFHPEYGYYLDCQRYATSYGPGPLSSDEFDSKLRVMTYAEAVANQLLVEHADPTPTEVHFFDPANPHADPYGAFAAAHGAGATAFVAKLAAYVTVPITGGSESYTMAEAAAMITRCGGVFGVAASPSCKGFGTGLNDDLVEEEWEKFKSMYLAEKYRFQKQAADALAKSSCGAGSGSNVCIGSDKPNEWMPRMASLSGTGVPYGQMWMQTPLFWGCQPCSYWSYSYYTDKVKRFHDPAQIPMSGSSPQQAAYQNFLLTGECPVATAWRGLIEELAVSDQLTATGLDLSSDPAYISLVLARADHQPVSSVQADTWTGTLDGSNNLHITLDPVTGGDCEVVLTSPAPGFDWTDIIAIPRLVAGDAGAFTLTVFYLNGTGAQQSIQVQGTMCADVLLAPCNFPPVCQPNGLAYGLERLMDMLAQNGDIDASTDRNLSTTMIGTSPAPTVSLAEMMGYELRSLLSSASGDLKWRYDAVNKLFYIGRGSTATLPRIVVRVEEAIWIDPASDMDDVVFVDGINAAHENFFTVRVQGTAHVDLGMLRCALWLETAQGLQPVSPGNCALPEPLSCAGNDEQLLADLFAVARERLLHHAGDLDASIDLLASPAMTDQAHGLLIPLLCNAFNELSGTDPFGTGGCTGTSTTSTVMEGGVTYDVITFGSTGCPVVRMPQGAFDDLRNPRVAGAPDEQGRYHALKADVLEEGMHVGTMMMSFDCIAGFKVCDPCEEECDEGLAGRTIRGLLDVLSERMATLGLLPASSGPEADLFASPAMTDELEAVLGPILCPSCPAGSFATTVETEIQTLAHPFSRLTYHFKPGCVSLSVMTNAPFGVSLTPPELTGPWSALGDPDANGLHYRFVNYFDPSIFPFPQPPADQCFVVADFSCLQLPLCPVPPCDVAQKARLHELFDLVEWSVRNGHDDDLFTSPLMTSELESLLGPVLCSACAPGTYTSIPVAEHVGSDYILRFPEGDCLKATIPDKRINNDMMFGPWVAIDQADAGGFHHRFRSELSDENGPIGNGVVVDVSCLDLNDCGMADLSVRCEDPENTLLTAFVNTIAERVQHNIDISDLDANIDLFASPLMTPALSAWLVDHPLFCGGCSPGAPSTTSTFISTTEALFQDDCTKITFPSSINTTTYNEVGEGYWVVDATPQLGEEAVVVRIPVRYNGTSHGYIEIKVGCVDLPYCCLPQPGCSMAGGGLTRPGRALACGEPPANMPCTAEVASCPDKWEALQGLAADFNTFASGEGGTASIDVDWIAEHPCYFVNEYLCPCLDGYMAKLASAMGDGVLSDEEQADPTLWCIQQYCQLPQAPCPIPPVLPIPDLTVDPGDPCVDNIGLNAIMNGQLAYEQQQQRYAADFRAAYNEQCLKGLESLTRSYTGKDEHHFTLYYYDQAGNLVRTVPPAGVQPLGFTTADHLLAQAVDQDRVSGTRRVFTDHAMATDHIYNSLDQPIRSRMPDQDAMRLWDTNEPVGLPEGLRITGSSFTGGGRGYLSGYVPVTLPISATVRERGYVFLTEDGGESWKRSSGLIGSDLRAAHMFSSTLGFAVGSESMMLRTEDGGHTWDMANAMSNNPLPAIPLGQGINDVFFATMAHGVMVGPGGFIRATNAGFASLNSVVAPTGIGDVHSLWGVYSGGATIYFIAAGSSSANTNGTMLRLGNTSWAQYPSSFGTVADLTCARPVGNEAYIGGTYGTLLHSTKPDTTTAIWRAVATHTTDDILDIWFQNTAEGLAIMDSAQTGTGVLRYTMDGGVTWTSCGTGAMDFTALHEYVSVSGVSEVLAVGEDGLIVRVIKGIGQLPVCTRRNGPTGAPDLLSVCAVGQGGAIRAFVGDATGHIHWCPDVQAEPIEWRSATAVFAGAPVESIAGAMAPSAAAINIAALANGGGPTTPGAKRVGTLDLSGTPTWSWGTASGANYDALTMRSGGDAFFYNAASDRYELHKLASATPTTVTNMSTGSGTAPSAVIRALLAQPGRSTVVALGVSGTNTLGTITGTSTAWTQRTFAISPLPIYDVIKDSDRSHAVGAQGTFYQCTAAIGTSWRIVPTRNTDDLHGIASTSGGVVGVGDHGTVIVGSLSGIPSSASFTRLASPVSTDLNDVVTNGNKVTIAGDQGLLLYADDITAPSFQVSYAPSGNINGLARLPGSPDQVFALGDGALMQRVSGTLRMPVADLFTWRANDVHFSDPGHGHVVGNNMLVRSTSDGGRTWQVVRPAALPNILSGTHLADLYTVYSTAPGKAVIGGDGCFTARRIDGLQHFPNSVSCFGTTTVWNDVAVSPSGVELYAGRLNATRGWYSYRIPSALPVGIESASAAGGSRVMNRVWSWPPDVEGNEDFLMMGDNSTTRFLRFRAGTLINDNLLSPAAGSVTALWMHDRKEGLLANANGAMYRITDVTPTAVSTEALSGAGPQPPVFPDAINGQNTAPAVLRTIGFTDRHQGFLGGCYDCGGTPTLYRYARTVRDEMGLYSQRFWYDRLGRLVLSQNTKQFNHVPASYSYTRYDELGRPVEVGEVDESVALLSTVFGTDVDGMHRSQTIDDAALAGFLSANAGTRREVVRTIYDAPLDNGYSTLFSSGSQENLRLRVAATTFQRVYNADPLFYDHGTHYSYDIHGNVQELLQVLIGMGNYILMDENQYVKSIRYTYDLISGNVKQVDYQDRKADQFHHAYTYDADNRIVKVKTSLDGMFWQNDADYFYYPHGPLLRTELGENKVQGIDYAYTLQGWLKGVNSERLDPANDMGYDAIGLLHPHDQIGRDAFGYSLGYYANDYEGIDAGRWDNSSDRRPFAPYDWDAADHWHPLYNGNIAHTVHALEPRGGGWASSSPGDVRPALAGVYGYDQLNRLRTWHTFKSDLSTNDWAAASAGLYEGDYTFDANGNLGTLTRKDQFGVVYDDLTYHYTKPGGRLRQNRLYHLWDDGADNVVDPTDPTDTDVDDLKQVTSAFVDDPIIVGDENTANNYGYDVLGQLVRDDQGEIANIEWTVNGKVRTVTRPAGSTLSNLTFDYGADGQRIAKTVDGTGTCDFYVRDAQGNVMAIYHGELGQGSLQVTERPIYGSTRLGEYVGSEELAGSSAYDPEDPVLPEEREVWYELTDHLGNVMSVVDGQLLGSVGAHHPHEVSSSGYEPFGSLLPGRNYKRGTTRVRPHLWIVNEEFEEAVASGGTVNGWSSLGSATLSVDGSGGFSNRLKVENATQGNGAQLWFPTVVGEVYEVTLTVYSDPLLVQVDDTAGTHLATATPSPYVTITFTATSTISQLKVVNNHVVSGFSFDFFIDDVMVKGAKAVMADYRYGFNGKENDNEVYNATGTFQDYGMRSYDPRIGRFISVDPLAAKFPMLTPYQFASNNPIRHIDLDGMEGTDPPPVSTTTVPGTQIDAGIIYHVETTTRTWMEGHANPRTLGGDYQPIQEQQVSRTPVGTVNQDGTYTFQLDVHFNAKSTRLLNQASVMQQIRNLEGDIERLGGASQIKIVGRTVGTWADTDDPNPELGKETWRGDYGTDGLQRGSRRQSDVSWNIKREQGIVTWGSWLDLGKYRAEALKGLLSGENQANTTTAPNRDPKDTNDRKATLIVTPINP